MEDKDDYLTLQSKQLDTDLCYSNHDHSCDNGILHSQNHYNDGTNELEAGQTNNNDGTNELLEAGQINYCSAVEVHSNLKPVPKIDGFTMHEEAIDQPSEQARKRFKTTLTISAPVSSRVNMTNLPLLSVTRIQVLIKSSLKVPPKSSRIR